jgi:hypothetical protein
VVLVQPFLTAPSLDRSATACVVAFSVAIPFLAALVLVNRQEVIAVHSAGYVRLDFKEPGDPEPGTPG